MRLRTALPRVRLLTELPKARLRTALPKARHYEGFSLWQSLVAPGRQSEQSEESPTRLYAVNTLSLVGFEEILRCRSG